MITNFSSNSTLKYSGNLGGGATVPANSYAIATYRVDAIPGSVAGYGVTNTSASLGQVYYGAGQTIPSSFSGGSAYAVGGSYFSVYFNLVSCVYFTNSP